MKRALDLDRYNLRGRFLKLDVDSSFNEATNSKIKKNSGSNINSQTNFPETQQQQQFCNVYPSYDNQQT